MYAPVLSSPTLMRKLMELDPSTVTTERLMCVPPENVAVLWHVIGPMLDAAYAGVDEFAPPDLLEGLSNGKLLLWISVRDGEIIMALVTALLPRPSGLACKLMVCGGSDPGSCIAELGQIESYARAEGCVKMFAEGRPGWARVLTGYDIKRLVLEKRLI